MGTTAHDESYLSRYRTNIVSKLETIDLFLKTKTPPYKKAEVRAIFGMTKDELDKILNENNIKSITPSSFAVIMKNGSGELCRAFKRQLECGVTESYSPEQVSYIYDIDIDVVLNAYASMGVCKLHKGLLETLFSNIYI